MAKTINQILNDILLDDSIDVIDGSPVVNQIADAQTNSQLLNNVEDNQNKIRVIWV